MGKNLRAVIAALAVMAAMTVGQSQQQTPPPRKTTNRTAPSRCTQSNLRKSPPTPCASTPKTK